MSKYTVYLVGEREARWMGDGDTTQIYVPPNDTVTVEANGFHPDSEGNLIFTEPGDKYLAVFPTGMWRGVVKEETK